MNKLKCYFFLLILLNICNQVTAQTDADEYMAIGETLSHYLDGGTYKDFTRFSKAFHKDATMKHIGDDEYKAVNALNFFKRGWKTGPPAERTTKIVSINFKGKAANAVLHIDYPTSRIWDFMNLLKIDGQWQIVSKIFSFEEKGENGQTAPLLSQSEKEVLAVLHRWKCAYINRDAEEVERILADNWTYGGQTNVKHSTVEGTKNSKVKWLSVDFQDLKTQDLGEVVIVSGKETLKTKENDKIHENTLMFTDVFQRINGEWQAVSTHSSAIKE